MLLHPNQVTNMQSSIFESETIEFVNGFSHNKFVNQLRGKKVVSLAEENAVNCATEEFFKSHDLSGETFANCAVGIVRIKCFIEVRYLQYPTRYLRPL